MKVLVTYNIPREPFAKLGKEHTITMPERTHDYHAGRRVFHHGRIN